VSGSFTPNGELDVSTGLVIGCFGKKKSGKSVLAMLLARSYPGDIVVIDVAGDDGPVPPLTRTQQLSNWAQIDDPVHEISGTVDELPDRWPEHLREDKKRLILRYVPDAGSATFLDDMDAVVALAYSHGRCCLLVHEMGVLAPVGKVRPHTRRVLMHNRHRQLTLIGCAPRPKGIDPLFLGQADLVYTFDVVQEMDRVRIAETIGWPAQEFNDAVQDLGPHEYLRYDANEPKPDNADDADDPRLMHFPALPQDVVDETVQWSQGKRPPPER
jgi:hypothetical protein